MGAVQRGRTKEALARALEIFTLARAKKIAAGLTPAQRTRVAQLKRAARSRVAAADRLVDAHTAAALALYRDAAVLLVGAALVAREEAANVDGLDARRAWDHLVAAVDDERAIPPAVREAFELFRSESLLAFDQRAEQHRRAVEEAVFWLNGRVEARTVRALVAVQIVRVALALALLVMGGKAIASFALAPKNIALHKAKVTASSRFSGMPEPSALVDGDRWNMGAHTSKESSPWVEIDLGKLRFVRRIQIWNRNDGYANDALPLAVHVSEGEAEFREIARKEQSFPPEEPWTVEVGANVKRIRLTGPPHGYVALTEVEVFQR